MSITPEHDGYDDYIREERMFRAEEWRQLSDEEQMHRRERAQSFHEDILRAEEACYGGDLRDG